MQTRTTPLFSASRCTVPNINVRNFPKAEPGDWSRGGKKSLYPSSYRRDCGGISQAHVWGCRAFAITDAVLCSKVLVMAEMHLEYLAAPRKNIALVVRFTIARLADLETMPSGRHCYREGDLPWLRDLFCGLSRRISASQGVVSLTDGRRSSTMCGTRRWMSSVSEMAPSSSLCSWRFAD